ALIAAKVGEEEAFRLKLASSAARRRQRKQPVGTRTEPASPVHPAAESGVSPASDDGQWMLDSGEGVPERRANPSLTVQPEEEEGGVSEGAGEPGNHSGRVSKFEGDRCWYRARVLCFLEGGFADLYYVDYGDNGKIPIARLQMLRSDFLSLPFQAVECSLDEVQPIGEEWSDEAMNCFESLTYCAEWKTLLARICSYSQSGGVTRPQVKLFDRTHGKNLDIGEELIRLGHAVRCPQTPGATAGGGGETGGKSTTASLQTLLNDVAGGLDGRLFSDQSIRSLEEQLPTSRQSHPEPAPHSAEDVPVLEEGVSRPAADRSVPGV
ncbi:tudor and KH domain-containing protein-like, partial [Mustelus asterias]